MHVGNSRLTKLFGKLSLIKIWRCNNSKMAATTDSLFKFPWSLYSILEIVSSEFVNYIYNHDLWRLRPIKKQCVSCPLWRGYSNYFLTGCVSRGLKLLPISKDFSPSKMTEFENVCKSSPIVKASCTTKYCWFYKFCSFSEMRPSCKDIFVQNETHVWGLMWESNPFGQHISVGLYIWGTPSLIFQDFEILIYFLYLLLSKTLFLKLLGKNNY